MNKSTRVDLAKLSIWLGFVTIGVGAIFCEKEVAIQLIESIGWFLTAVGGGFMGTKIAEHGTKKDVTS